MKKFRFPLRPVTVLRAHQELRAREAFGAAVHTYVKAEQDLADTRARVKQFEVSLFEGRCHSFSAAGESQALTAYRREWLAESEAERTLFSAHSAMQQRRAEYLDAHRRLKVVQRLEEKARAAHRLETAREEQAEFDDFASRMIGRRSSLRA
jgi:flagellar FliJ protein